MKKYKKLIIVAGSFILLGVLMLGAGTAFGGYPGFYIDAAGIHSYTNNKALENFQLAKTKMDAFDDLKINMRRGDIIIEESDGYYLEYNLCADEEPEFNVENKKLIFKSGKTESEGIFSGIQFLNFGSLINNSTHKHEKKDFVKIYLPKPVYLKTSVLNTDYGNTSYLMDSTVDFFEVNSSFGNVEVANVKSKELKVSTLNGSIKLKDSQSESLKIDNDFGSLELINSDIGDTKITVLNGKIIMNDINSSETDISSDFGSVELTNAETGNAKITMLNGGLKLANFTFTKLNLSNDFGDITGDALKGNELAGEILNGTCNLTKAEIETISIESDFGSVNLELLDAYENYNYNLETDFGEIYINDVKKKREAFINNNSKQNVKIRNLNGNIKIENRP